MASSAVKSTSKRGNSNSSTSYYNRDSNSTQKTAPTVRKRSLSVSAISRAKSSPDISTDFANKRENPLFWTSVSSPTDKESDEISATVKRLGNDKQREKIGFESVNKKGSGKTDAADQRGRAVTRNSGVKNGVGRSISRVRGRSVSRGHYGAYESEKEQEVATLTRSATSDLKQVIYNVNKDNLVRNGTNIPVRIRGSETINSQCPATECSEDDSACSFQISTGEDGISICSLSEAEEKTVRAVCEQMKGLDASANGIYETVRSEVRRAISDMQNDIESVIRRNKLDVIATPTVTDIHSDLVNSGAAEFMMDIRREYARKLGESEERARKLQADLAVEEHRGQELRRILQEILPDPKTSNPQRSRVGRKRSSERKKISKRLTEEAMAYFDECVSISTFDSSDFSAPEDPPRCLAGPSNLVHGSVSAPGGGSSINLPPEMLGSHSNNEQATQGGHNGGMNSCEDSNLTANSRYEPAVDRADQKVNSGGNNESQQFSFAQKPKENFESHDIRSYIKNFERGVAKRNMVIADGNRSTYDSGEYDLHGHVERLLFDRVFSRNRIESGSLHLCAGNLAISCSPFGSIV